MCLVCNPELVKTGLDLLDFPTICFLQTGYSVYTVQQALAAILADWSETSGASAFSSYAETAQIACLQHDGQENCGQPVNLGRYADTGLEVLNSDGDSIEVALAKQLLGKQLSMLKPACHRLWPPVLTIRHLVKGLPTHGRLDSDELSQQFTRLLLWHPGLVPAWF